MGKDPNESYKRSPDQVKYCLPTLFSHFSALDVYVGILQYSLQLHSIQCLLTSILLQQEIQIVMICFL